MRNDDGEKTAQQGDSETTAPLPEFEDTDRPDIGSGTERWDIPGANLVPVQVDGHGIAGFDPYSEFAISIVSPRIPYIVRIHGEADLYSDSFLRERLSYLFTELAVRELIIDMTYCVYVDSSALAILLDMYRQYHEAGGWIRLTNVRDDVRRIFQLTGLDRFIEIVL